MAEADQRFAAIDTGMRFRFWGWRRRRRGDARNARFFLVAADCAQEPREEDPNAVADQRDDRQQNEEDYENFHASQAVRVTSRSNDA